MNAIEWIEQIPQMSTSTLQSALIHPSTEDDGIVLAAIRDALRDRGEIPAVIGQASLVGGES